jgi:hypothetical protein
MHASQVCDKHQGKKDPARKENRVHDYSRGLSKSRHGFRSLPRGFDLEANNIPDESDS